MIDSDVNFTKTLPGAPEDWQPPQPPEDWVHVPDISHGEPPFADVDNPGGWSPYTFQAKFTVHGKKGTYSHHEMPAGAQVVPKNAAGDREVNGWKFFYKGWHHHLDNGDFWRKDTSRDNIFPPNRKSKLDGEILKNMGLSRDRMINKDAIFFI